VIAECLVDTDTLSAIMRRDPQAESHARLFLVEHGRFSFSIITRYEILRGLRSKGATAQEAAFERFCGANIVLPLSDPTIVRAAGIYANLRKAGVLIGDADILIAATALEHDLNLVTNNTRHFLPIPDLRLQNWLNE
jgi:tRNA(fMet)-specific endonuclease VapC